MTNSYSALMLLLFEKFKANTGIERIFHQFLSKIRSRQKTNQKRRCPVPGSVLYSSSLSQSVSEPQVSSFQLVLDSSVKDSSSSVELSEGSFLLEDWNGDTESVEFGLDNEYFFINSKTIRSLLNWKEKKGKIANGN